MSPAEIPKFLEQYSFSGLTIKKHEEDTYTFSFHSYDHKALVKALGEPSITSSGKVAVFTIPNTAKIGVSPGNRLVRLVDLKPGSVEVLDTHLSIREASKELDLEYVKAQTTPKLRLPFIDKLWDFFNETKFAGRMKKPFLAVGSKALRPGVRGLKDARGIYYPQFKGPNGSLWMADYMFNAPKAFFYEVFVHEMCHQAVSCLDHVNDNSKGGHGPNWQAWMRRVGLDPRRYDPTDDSVYQTSTERAIEESDDYKRYGPPATPAELKQVMSRPHPTSTEAQVGVDCVWVIKGRIKRGHLKGKVFTYNDSSRGNVSLRWKEMPLSQFFKD